ncbi:MAG: IS5 family transposase, partial [Nanoarchaeota archaeon]|nr:IS5 family transposase [Nanoarchaeota archaeon]
MDSLTNFALKQKYDKVKKLRSRLEEMKNLFDWNAFISLFPEKENTVGRPTYDKEVMIKCLLLQSWYGISDEELEFQINDRLSFQQFLGFPKNIPDYSTIWRFREGLTESDIIDKIWEEQKRQFVQHDIKVKEGKIQDATFIQADPGKKNSGMNNRGREAKTSRSKDGSWTKKKKKSYFGFKSHTKMQRGSKIIEEVAVTTAKTHDNKIDLANEDEIIYRDRGYSGSKTKARGDATMKKGNLTITQKLRNKRIAKKRAEGEHPYGTIHRSFKG